MPTLRFTLSYFGFFAHQTRLRFPFRYGIASMTEVPQQFVRATVERGGRACVGLACEGLPPKWFTKNPETIFERDLADMQEVIHHAADVALVVAGQPVSFFDFSRELSRAQFEWARGRGFPPLLAGLGVSLIERAVLDALARSVDRPLHLLVRENALGIRLGELYPQLEKRTPAELLPATPRARVHVRHTIGLTDPLTPSEIPADDRVDDGLPQDLESSIRAYSLRYFKIKLSGNPARDRDRLRSIVDVCRAQAGDSWFATVDGNENFQTFGAFRDFWDEVINTPALRALGERLLVVEQPVHRDHALSEDAADALRAWPRRPRLIIDESDGALGDVLRALDLGYNGTSHKNCKGIIKGIANACMLEHRRVNGADVVLTGEDLCNLGPVPLLQDLAMMALLGIAHVERNGHHYYRGLSMWPADWQEQMRAAHGDLYCTGRDGVVTLDIHDGQVALGSVNAAPFGCRPLFGPFALSPQEPDSR